jgi:hypothetical protein
MHPNIIPALFQKCININNHMTNTAEEIAQKVRPRPNLENIDDGVEQQKKRFADEVAEILGEHSLSRLRLGPRLRF